jgi:phage terminase large subunit GpA-like protein
MNSTHERLEAHAFDIFQVQGKQTVVEWAEENAYLSERVTEMAGRYRTTDHPYVREVLNCYQDPRVKKVALCWGSQTSKTTTIYVGLGWAIDQSPGPILWVWSNEKQARNFANDRFIPFCEDSSVIAKHLPKTIDGKIDRDRASALRVEFDRCTLNMIGGQSQRNVRNYPVQYLVIDELDIIPETIRREVEQRIKGRRSYMIIMSSSPLEDGGIWAEYLTGDQRKFLLPCPHCKKWIPLEWRKEKGVYNLNYPEEAKGEDGSYDWHMIKAGTFYSCQECGGPINDTAKLKMLRQGKWEPTARGEPGVRSYHLNSLYSPTITFGEMFTRWLRAQDSLDGLKQFITGWLAEPWQEEILDVTEEATHALAGEYKRGEILGEFRLMGVDVQRSHFVWIVRGMDSDGTSYLLDNGFAPTWDELDKVFENYDCSAAVMDTGFGERTQECYEEIFRRRSTWWASKGWKKLAQPVAIKAVDPFTGTAKGGKAKIRLLHVDVGVFGGEMLKRRAGLVKGFQLYQDPDREYVRQLNAKFIIEKTTRQGEVVQEWRTKRHGQDHFWDCEVYLLALSKILGLGNVTRKDKQNDKEKKGEPRQQTDRRKKAGPRRRGTGQNPGKAFW